MKSLYFYSFVFIVLLLSCKNTNNTNVFPDESKKEKQEQLQNEDFFIFFNKFKNDSLFQKEHCSKQISIYEYDEYDNLLVTKKSGLHFIDFSKDDSSHNLEENAYRVEITNLKDSVDYHLWGIDNGINLSFMFVRKGTSWQLNSIYDFSN